MNKRWAIAAVTSIGLLSAGCQAVAGRDDGSATSLNGPLAAVTWVDGTPPSLEFTAPFDLGEDRAFRVAKEGTGEVVEPGAVVALNYIIVTGQDATVLASTYVEGAAPMPYQMAEAEPEGDYLWPALIGQKVGANVITAFRETPQTVDESGSASPSAPTTYLVALTIISMQQPLERAEGVTVSPEDPNLPQVTLGADGRPSIKVPAGAEPPTELVSQLLIRGSGEPVGEAQGVTAHYSGWLWDGTAFDSSWDRGQPYSFSMTGGVIQGWLEGLVGVPVGSQVLLVIPPDLGYGDEERTTIPANSTLIFVVDVLAAVPPLG
ncbi:MAG: FKBP-type peptidyl-prolyl cis-trans isomerase [Bifidobacteriaceae bacterium]|jgi:peptidylprolyl isomerase|nr:FKBP-type peptidyl-prolyl cis-trans isomerase [Bifidobacteriaceae bacterium]